MSDNIIYLQGYNIFINGEYYNLDNFYKNYANNNHKNIIITIKELINYLHSVNLKFKKYNNYFILFNGKLISNNIKIKYCPKSNNKINNIDNINIIDNIDNIDIIEKQNGGSIIDAFMAIIKIGEFFLKIGDFIIWLLKFIAWFIQFIFWILVDFLNPVNFFTDFFNSLMMIVVAICRLPFDLILSLFHIVMNTIGGWMQGFWGWDMSSLSKNDKNSLYFKSFNRSKGQKSYITNSNTVPFSIILGTIICPPMGVFMDMGTSGWINILICALLTLLFYLPGLCYALLIIYS